MQFLHKPIMRLVRLTLRYPKMTLLLVVLATVFSGFLIQKIKIRSNFSDLLPDNHPAVISSRKLDKTVGGASFIVVTVDTSNPQAAIAFLDDLRKRVEAFPEIRFVDDRLPTEFLSPRGLLYLSLADLSRLKEQIQKKIEQGKLRKAQLYLDFEDHAGGFDRDIQEVTGKYSLFLGRHSHYQNKAGTLFVSLIKPDWRTTEVPRTEDFLVKLQDLIVELHPQNYDASLKVRLTGPYVKVVTQKKILIKDAALVSILSFVGSIVYLFFHFRRKRAVFLIAAPMFVSSLWALGAAYIFFGSLNLFSSAICAILLGLAADFGIHIYSEYHRYRKSGESTREALILAMSHLGGAFIAASSTTAAAFFALGLSQFKAFHETGIIAGVGIALSFLAFVVMLPPMTLILEKWRPEKPIQEWSERAQKFSKVWLQWISSRKNFWISGLVLLLPLVAVGVGRLHFDYNLTRILGSQETRETDRKVDAIFNHTVNPEVTLASDYEDARHLVAAIRSVQKRHAAEAGGTTIKEALAMSDLVPGQQSEKIQKIHEIRSLFTPLVLRSMSEEEKKTYSLIAPMLHPVPFSLSDVPEQLKNKFQDRDGKRGRMIFVFPNFDPLHADRLMKFVEEVREVKCPECQGPFYASGESTVYYEIVKMLFHEGRYVIVFTLVTVFGTLWINFRSFKSTLVVFCPLVVGLLATLGWMAVLGIPFNIINMAAVPIIIGTSDDYSVHFYQRFLDHPKTSLHETYQLTFRPILGSALTTLIGFGSLGLANMGGVRSFGLLCVVGISSCLVAVLVWFPSLLAMVKRRGA